MGDAPRFNRCLVGGTFDRLHAGHRLLLDAAVRAAQHVEVHITSDKMADQKSVNMQSFETRRDEVLNWADRHAPRRVTVHELTDAHGPAPHHAQADCIAATPETKSECERINLKRADHGLPLLHIVEVAHLRDVDGGIISSTRIRNGLVDPDGHPWMADKWNNAVLRMHPRAEPELKTPMGTLFEGPEDDPEIGMAAALDGLPTPHGAIITVGDVTTKTMLDMGLTPDIALIDGQTKRTELEEELKVNTSRFHHQLTAENPAGLLTPSLNQAISSALLAEDTVVIEVEGEEDLAPLVLHCLAPIGTVILYGQPRTGVVLQYTSLTVKERCRHLLSLFEVE